MSKYLYTATTKIDDVAPHQQKPPQKPPTTAKTTEGGGLNRMVSIVSNIWFCD
jgi:hypothetical protein